MTVARSKWTERIAEWRQSGGSAAEFARARGFSESTLKWWVTRLKREESAPTRVRLARVVTAAKGSSESGVLTVAVGTATIAVRRGFAAALLREIVTALEGPR